MNVWKHGVFEVGDHTVESLERQVDRSDFAVLILTPDDISLSRGKEMLSPRDHVLFELGLFMGRLGRRRAYYVFVESGNVKLPGDLLGLTGAGYRAGANWLSRLGPACNRRASGSPSWVHESGSTRRRRTRSSATWRFRSGSSTIGGSSSCLET